MPGFDRTGPEGQGSQTGRRSGKCNPNAKQNNEQDGIDNDKSKLGPRRGMGMARGSRFGKGKGRRQGLGKS